MFKPLVSAIFAACLLFGFSSANAAPKPKTEVKSKAPVKKEPQGITLYSAGKFAEAKPFLEKECKGNSGKACLYLAMVIESGLGNTPKDPEKSIPIYDQSCTLGIADACGTLGDLYLWGADYLAEDLNKAAKYHEKSCNLDKKGGINCVMAGDAYFFGDGYSKDLPKAKTYYEKGCGNDDSFGCLYLADMYLYGDLGEVDFEKAGKLYKQGCDLKNYKACFELGVMHETGEGRPINKDLAYDLYEMGCNNKFGDGCYGVGILLYNGTPKRPVNFSAALESFKKGCDLSSSNSCFSAGHVYAFGKAGPKNTVLAKEFLEKALKLAPNNEKAKNLLKEIN